VVRGFLLLACARVSKPGAGRRQATGGLVRQPNPSLRILWRLRALAESMSVRVECRRACGGGQIVCQDGFDLKDGGCEPIARTLQMTHSLREAPATMLTNSLRPSVQDRTMLAPWNDAIHVGPRHGRGFAYEVEGEGAMRGSKMIDRSIMQLPIGYHLQSSRYARKPLGKEKGTLGSGC